MNAEAAAKVGRQFNVQYTTSLQQVLGRNDVNALTICTPTTSHFEIAMQALDAGKHVLVEKPMTNTAAEATQLIEQAERRGLRIMPGHIERFNPAVTFLKRLVKTGDLGNVILFLSRRVGRWPERIGDVGVVRDTAIHDIDLARFVFEEEVESVFARTGSMKHKREDYAEIMLQFPKSRTAFIDANWLTPRKTRTLIVTGSEATVQLDYITQEMTIENSGMTSKHTIEKREPLAIELAHFVESIINDEPFAVTAVDGLRAVEICEAVLESGAKGKTLRPAAS